MQRAVGDAVTLSALGMPAALAAVILARTRTVRAGRTAALAVGAAAPLSVAAFVVSGLMRGNAVTGGGG